MGHVNVWQSVITKALFFVATCIAITILATSGHAQNGYNNSSNTPSTVPCPYGATRNINGDCPTSPGMLDNNGANSTPNNIATPGHPTLPASPTPSVSPTSPGK